MPLDSPSITGEHLHEQGSLSIFRSAVAFAECNWTGEFYPAGFSSVHAGRGEDNWWRSASSSEQERRSLNDLEVRSTRKGKISPFWHQLRKLELSKFLYFQGIQRLSWAVRWQMPALVLSEQQRGTCILFLETFLRLPFPKRCSLLPRESCLDSLRDTGVKQLKISHGNVVKNERHVRKWSRCCNMKSELVNLKLYQDHKTSETHMASSTYSKSPG